MNECRGLERLARNLRCQTAEFLIDQRQQFLRCGRQQRRVGSGCVRLRIHDSQCGIGAGAVERLFRERALTAGGCFRFTVLPEATRSLRAADVRIACPLNDRVGIRFQQVTASLQLPSVKRNVTDILGVVGEAVGEIDMSTRDLP